MRERSTFEREIQDLFFESPVASGEPLAVPPATQAAANSIRCKWKIKAGIPVPFAPSPPEGSYWPLITSDGVGKQRVVAYVDTHGGCIGRVGQKARQFLADRLKGLRYHAGIDLHANRRDPVVACEGGKIIGWSKFLTAKSGQETYSILVDHGHVVVNYGEVDPDSLQRLNLRVTSDVSPGQIIGFVSDTDMLHFETYRRGTTRTFKWMKREARPPAALLNPTKYLLALKERGLTAAQASVKAGVPQGEPASSTLSEDHIRFAQRVLNAIEGERLDPDGKLGPKTRAALERFRANHKLGAGGELDDKTELALVQRALEEIRQQSFFAQIGVHDSNTDWAIESFKAQHGLGPGTLIDSALRAALIGALARRGGGQTFSPLSQRSSQSVSGAGTSSQKGAATITPVEGIRSDIVIKSGGWGNWKGRATKGSIFINSKDIADKYDVAVAVAADVETGGAFDKVQMYDVGILSWGIKQWTVHKGSLQGVLAFIKDNLDSSGRGALWPTIFPGIDFKGGKFFVEGVSYATPRDNEDADHKALRKVFRGTDLESSFDQARTDHWLRVFALAGRHEAIRKLQFEYAVKELHDNLNKSLGQVLLKRNDVQSANVSNYRRVGGYIENSPLSLALFNGMETQNPKWTYVYMKRIVDLLAKEFGTYDMAVWPANWPDAFAVKLKEELQGSGVGCWGTKALLNNPKCKDKKTGKVRTSRTEKILRSYHKWSQYLPKAN